MGNPVYSKTNGSCEDGAHRRRLRRVPMCRLFYRRSTCLSAFGRTKIEVMVNVFEIEGGVGGGNSPSVPFVEVQRPTYIQGPSDKHTAEMTTPLAPKYDHQKQ